MLFKNGNVEAQKVGSLSKSQLTAFLTATSKVSILHAKGGRHA